MRKQSARPKRSWIRPIKVRESRAFFRDQEQQPDLIHRQGHPRQESGTPPRFREHRVAALDSGNTEP
jgi:hypothetical protein